MFLRKELLVRLAGIMKEISLLPQALLQMPSSKLVREWYQQSFTDLLEYEHTGPSLDTFKAYVLKRIFQILRSEAVPVLGSMKT